MKCTGNFAGTFITGKAFPVNRLFFYLVSGLTEVVLVFFLRICFYSLFHGLLGHGGQR
jgi:hypothetical protein